MCLADHLTLDSQSTIVLWKHTSLQFQETLSRLLPPDSFIALTGPAWTFQKYYRYDTVSHVFADIPLVQTVHHELLN